MIFEQPFFVSSHAVKRFQERVAKLPPQTVRNIIQASLQPDRRRFVGRAQGRNSGDMPVYRGKFQSEEYLIPVIWKIHSWPAVTTILKPDMFIRWV